MIRLLTTLVVLAVLGLCNSCASPKVAGRGGRESDRLLTGWMPVDRTNSVCLLISNKTDQDLLVLWPPACRIRWRGSSEDGDEQIETMQGDDYRLIDGHPSNCKTYLPGELVTFTVPLSKEAPVPSSTISEVWVSICAMPVSELNSFVVHDGAGLVTLLFGYRQEYIWKCDGRLVKASNLMIRHSNEYDARRFRVAVPRRKSQ